MEPKEKKVSIGLLWAIIAIPVFEILRVPLGVLFWLISEAVKAALTPCMWFFERGVIGSFWSYQIPIVPYAVAIIFKVIAIPVVVIVLFLALIIGAIILLLMMLLIWLDQIHILAWIIAPIFAYYAYMTDFWADQREDIRDRLLQIRAVLVNIVSWFASFRAIKIKLADGRTVRYKIKRKYSKTVLALAVIFISIGMIGRSTEFFFIQRRSHTLSYKSSSYIITMNGQEEEGVPTGIILEPGQSARISYISGKIISNNKTGFSVPIWGVPIEKTDSGWIPLMPYAKKGIWTNAVVVLLGPVGTEFVYPFQKDNHEIVVKNTTSKSQEIRLFFHDAPGYFQDNNGDVKFLVEKLPTVMARVSNVDDKAIMYINDQEVITTTWGSGPGGKSVGHRPGDSGWINITPYLKIGDNIFRLWVWNAAGCCSVSGTFEVQANDIATLTRSFKREDSSAGVKYDETVVLFFP